MASDYRTWHARYFRTPHSAWRMEMWLSPRWVMVRRRMERGFFCFLIKRHSNQWEHGLLLRWLYTSWIKVVVSGGQTWWILFLDMTSATSLTIMWWFLQSGEIKRWFFKGLDLEEVEALGRVLWHSYQCVWLEREKIDQEDLGMEGVMPWRSGESRI